jgi:hypothetical protein
VPTLQLNVDLRKRVLEAIAKSDEAVVHADEPGNDHAYDHK